MPWPGSDARFLRLLATMVAYTLLTALAHGGLLRRLLIDLLIVGILLASAQAAKLRRSHRLTLLGIGLTMVLGKLSNEVLPSSSLALVSACLGVLFFAIISVMIVREVLRQEAVTADTIMGAICAYILLGATWAGAYSVIDLVQPESFSLPTTAAASDREGLYAYFSFVTLTTLGYGDIQPLGKMARTLAWMEAACGQIFLAVLVARLVGLQIAQTSGRRPPGD